LSVKDVWALAFAKRPPTCRQRVVGACEPTAPVFPANGDDIAVVVDIDESRAWGLLRLAAEVIEHVVAVDVVLVRPPIELDALH
jgi:hypothetical protein